MDAPGFALVVGAGSGIGLETALLFAERGARGVVFADKNLDTAREAAKKSEALAIAKDYQALAIYVDVCSRDAVHSMVSETISKFGRIDYAINCAGMPRLKDAPVGEIEDEELELVHNVNCRGVLYCLEEEIKAMKSQDERFTEGRSGRRSIGRGSIIVITSLSALIGSARSTTYTASKFAARGIIKCAALENRKTGIRINEICPGFTNTPMLKNAMNRNAELKSVIESAMPLERSAEPEEIAGVVHFLATPSASFIHGQSIVVDSGVSIAVHS